MGIMILSSHYCPVSCDYLSKTYALWCEYLQKVGTVEIMKLHTAVDHTACCLTA